MGKRCGSERCVVAVPEVGLSIVAGMIVAVDVDGIVIFESPSDLVEEFEELGGGFVGEVSGETGKWEGVAVHGGCLGDQGLSSSRAGWRCSGVTDWALSSAAAVSA